jgi:hypothetical protein
VGQASLRHQAAPRLPVTSAAADAPRSKNWLLVEHLDIDIGACVDSMHGLISLVRHLRDAQVRP